MAGANKDQYEAASMTYIETIKDIRDIMHKIHKLGIAKMKIAVKLKTLSPGNNYWMWLRFHCHIINS